MLDRPLKKALPPPAAAAAAILQRQEGDWIMSNHNKHNIESSSSGESRSKIQIGLDSIQLTVLWQVHEWCVVWNEQVLQLWWMKESTMEIRIFLWNSLRPSWSELFLPRIILKHQFTTESGTEEALWTIQEFSCSVNMEMTEIKYSTWWLLAL